MAKITDEEKAKIIEKLEEAIKALEAIGDRFNEERAQSATPSVNLGEDASLPNSHRRAKYPSSASDNT